MARKNILDSLVTKGVITLDDIGSVKAEARKVGISVEEALYQRGIDENAVLEAKSEILGIPERRLLG
ncbi:MAG: hypothetical protein HYT40_01410, partial [Candidatus Sungbacteria bacterium]|nr:hypothetical protein [Candidatus Sungbacteria bacterium]